MSFSTYRFFIFPFSHIYIYMRKRKNKKPVRGKRHGPIYMYVSIHYVHQLISLLNGLRLYGLALAFWTLGCSDDTHFWWSGMPEPKHFMMLPNTEHSCITGILEAVPAASAWIQALLHKDAVPEVNWTINEEDGAITVTLGEEGRVHSAHVWWAYSCGENAFDGGKLRRDFRIASVDNPCNCGIYIEPEALCTNLKSWWNKEELEVNMVGGKRTYTAHIDAPEDGRWVAYFVDIKFLNRHGLEQLQQGDMAQMAAVLDKQTEINYQTLAKSGEIRKQKHADGNGQVLGWELLSQFDQFAGFPKDAGQFLEFTSEVSVFPNTWAYPEDCFAESCGVTLV